MDKIEYDYLDDIDAICDKEGFEGKFKKVMADKINEIIDWINSQ